MSRPLLALGLLALLAACGNSSPAEDQQAINRGVERSVNDVRLAEQAAGMKQMAPENPEKPVPAAKPAS